MTYSYDDLTDDIQAVIGKYTDENQRGRVARLIDISFRDVYNHLDFVGHPSVLSYGSITASGTYSTLPTGFRRIVRIEDVNGNQVWRRGETGGTEQEYEPHGATQIKWIPWLTAQAQYEVAYIATQSLNASMSATVSFTDTAYNFMLKKTVAILTRDPMWFADAERAWQTFRNRAWDEAEIPRVLRRDANYVLGTWPRP